LWFGQKPFGSGFGWTRWRHWGFPSPAALVLWALPSRLWQKKGFLFFLRGAYFLGLFLFLFNSIIEVAFFDEFNARFNYIAVDYLLFPTEVAGNIWQSYPVLWILAGVGSGALGSFSYHLSFVGARDPTIPARCGQGTCGSFGPSFGVGIDDPSHFHGGKCQNRVQNEVAGNGVLTFFRAVATNDLNYDAFYHTLDKTEGIRR
jgi:hypothetical protein